MRVGRFQVMAVLQAARAYACGLSLDESKSWGINRAIFYAAAKRGFRALGRKRPTTRPHVPVSLHRGPPIKAGKEEVFQVGDEIAYATRIGKETRFTIGGEVQTVEDYRKQIVSRFGGKYREAWKEALRIVRKYPESTLLSQSEFFQQVYRPVRDELSEKWTEMVTRA